MTRITKDPDVRRSELMDAAERLFAEKGYDHTSASDIIRAVGVAQGTFYYYFKSKDEILNAVIDRYNERYAEFVGRVADSVGMNALEKLQCIIDELFTFKNDRKLIAECLSLDGLMAKHERHRQNTETVIAPLVTRIIRQGVAEGLFEVEHPKETTELIILVVEHLHDTIKYAKDRKTPVKKVRAAEAMVEKALNAPKGSIRFKILK